MSHDAKLVKWGLSVEQYYISIHKMPFNDISILKKTTKLQHEIFTLSWDKFQNWVLEVTWHRIAFASLRSVIGRENSYPGLDPSDTKLKPNYAKKLFFLKFPSIWAKSTEGYQIWKLVYLQFLNDLFSIAILEKSGRKGKKNTLAVSNHLLCTKCGSQAT